MLDEVYQEFTRRCGRCCIAGGAARDTLMGKTPKDYDVFLFQDVHASAFDGLESFTALPMHKSEPFLIGNFKWNGLWIQVMRAQVPDVESLLDTFDWNVCLFAYDGKYVTRESVENIGVGKPLRLQRVTYPLSTIRRGFRFSERFQMELKYGDVAKLCEAVLARRGWFARLRRRIQKWFH